MQYRVYSKNHSLNGGEIMYRRGGVVRSICSIVAASNDPVVHRPSLNTAPSNVSCAALRKTVLVVGKGSLVSTVQARDHFRIANAIRIPHVVLVRGAVLRFGSATDGRWHSDRSEFDISGTMNEEFIGTIGSTACSSRRETKNREILRRDGCSTVRKREPFCDR